MHLPRIIPCLLLCSFSCAAQECVTTNVTAGSSRISDLTATIITDPIRIVVSYSNSTRIRDAAHFDADGSDIVVTGEIVDLVPSDSAETETFHTVTQSGRVYRHDANKPSALREVWVNDLRRASCSSDSLATAVFAQYEKASPEFRQNFDTSMLVVGTRYACATGRSDNRVYALDYESGRILWTFNGNATVDLDIITGMLLDLENDRVFVATDRTLTSDQNSLWALDLTGNKLWSVNLGQLAGAPQLRQNRLFINTLAGTIHAVNADSGESHWSFPLNDEGPRPAPFGLVAPKSGEFNDDVIIVWDFLGELHAIRDAGDSAIPVWTRFFEPAVSQTDFPAPRFQNFRTPLRIVKNGMTVFAAGDQGAVYEVDISSGLVTRTHVVDNADVPLTAIDGYESENLEGEAVIVGAENGKLARVCPTEETVFVSGFEPMDI
ncbi:MAG: PQQ-binding-like beta-propeller repeat protein [Pseudomonadota bacterium]